MSEVDLKVTEDLTTSYPSYYAVKEYGSSGSHEHIHVYVQGSDLQRQDNVRNRWKKVWNGDGEAPRPFLMVVPVKDRNRLIGQYLQKDQNVEVLWSTLEDSEIETLRASYKQAPLEAGKVVGRQITFSVAADRIIAFAKANDRPLDSKFAVESCIEEMYAAGFRMSGTLRQIRTIWMEIRMIQRQRLNGDLASDM